MCHQKFDRGLPKYCPNLFEPLSHCASWTSVALHPTIFFESLGRGSCPYLPPPWRRPCVPMLSYQLSETAEHVISLLPHYSQKCNPKNEIFNPSKRCPFLYLLSLLLMCATILMPVSFLCQQHLIRANNQVDPTSQLTLVSTVLAHRLRVQINLQTSDWRGTEGSEISLLPAWYLILGNLEIFLFVAYINKVFNSIKHMFKKNNNKKTDNLINKKQRLVRFKPLFCILEKLYYNYWISYLQRHSENTLRLV